MNRDLSGLTFSQLEELRESLHRSLNHLFDEAVAGRLDKANEDNDGHRIDRDPLHDGLPYRLVMVSLNITAFQGRRS